MFVNDHLCQDQNMCNKAIADSYFQEEKLTLDPSKNRLGNCEEISFVFWNEKWRDSQPVDFTMRYKKCYAMKKNDNEFKVPLIFYLQSVYKQPTFMGKVEYFVLFGYTWNLKTKDWERATDTDKLENITFRYEAKLNLK